MRPSGSRPSTPYSRPLDVVWDHSWTAHLAGALEPGYSRVLIHESVVSALRPQARVTTADLAMMAILSTKERTEEKFEKIIPNRRIRGTVVNRSDFKMKLISCFIV
ncbi:hypothetical protein PG999_010122 [Apiospora kogelbergensis]|uniref:Uncharacterized protein n=1 Tax=Apiospora kogelbergensis TaxID=1337665 RepID=A0AAW0QU32_9PEZI